jgi:hypothetical protein
MRTGLVCLLILSATTANAQESRFHADIRQEGEDLAHSCSGGLQVKTVIGCTVAVATEDPFHVAIGSVPPQNGMGFGLAFVEHYTPNDNWRLSWNADGVGAPSGAWRAGVYMKIIHTARPPITVVQPGAVPAGRAPQVSIREYPIINVYWQRISLDKVTLTAEQESFREKQTIVGSNVIYPVPFLEAFRPSLIGAINGRFVTINGSSTVTSVPQPGFAQFEEGLRLKPSLFDDRLRFDYLFDLQQFAASASSQVSFHRWMLDLKHEIPLYRTVSSTGPRDTNGPNECFESLGSSRCPPISYSRNLEGSVAIRFLTMQSGVSAGNSVPFYFQPTLGGSDLNGQRLLAAYDDYRFRAPNIFAVQESVEHSIWGPIGVYVLVEQGKVADQGTSFSGTELAHSFAVGLTLRAGGFPLINVTFAWGPEGHHLIGTIDSSLLGGSPRPSLY